MEKVPKKQKKAKNVSREELLLLTKEELADRIIQLECHNTNLKNIISKSVSDSSKTGNKQKQKGFDFSKSHYRHVLLHILYFGWDYQGFVVQEDTAQTIEHHLFNALSTACLVENREASMYHRCGRTDKGVSAYGQVISILLRSKHTTDKQNEPESIDNELPYCKILNRLLPKEIRAVGWVPIPQDMPEFSARFDCKQRHYKYYFPRGSLNIPAMRTACQYLIGNHDFRNLCKMDVGNGVTEFRRTVLNADIVAVDVNDVDKPTSMYYLLIEGNAFLWHQIRCTMAVLFLIGSGKETPEVISELLDVGTHQKKAQYFMAIDVPLNLFHCGYELESSWIYNKLAAHPGFARKPQYHMAIDVPLNLFHCGYELGSSWIYDIEELGKVIAHLQGEWSIQNIKATMQKDCIQDLEAKYKAARKKRTDDAKNVMIERDDIISYTDCLTQGIEARVYTPLLKRQTCSSLQERIEHYKKRRKIPVSEMNEK